MNVSTQFLDMVAEIVQASKLKISVADYLQDSLLRTLSLGANHEDRIRTIEFLEQTGCLQIRNDSFYITKNSVPDWIIQAGAKGYKQAFDLVPEFLPSSDWEEKFDHSVLREIGLRGEIAFIEQLRLRCGPNDQIKHVSLFDDSLGYDVLHESVAEQSFVYEVKTTSRPSRGHFEFFLSRHEFETSKKMINWRIACMRISEGQVSFSGFLKWENLKEILPIDQAREITWSVAKVTVEEANLVIDFDGPTPRKHLTEQLRD